MRSTPSSRIVSSNSAARSITLLTAGVFFLTGCLPTEDGDAAEFDDAETQPEQDEEHDVAAQDETEEPAAEGEESSAPAPDDAEEEIDAEGSGELLTFEIEPQDWNIDIYAELSRVTDHSMEDFEAAASDPADFGLPADAPDLQGYLTPGEYTFNEGAEPEDILQAMVDRTYGLLVEAGVTDSSEQHRVITVASLIEGEAQPEQYGILAGIVENRIVPNPETDGYLEIDTTVRYGLGDLDRDLTAQDREDVSNQYNTYQHTGLPPGPITTPTFDAIRAAAEPEDNSYYYWTLVNPDTMEAKFASDYDTHMQNAQEYRDYCDANPASC